MRECFLFSLQTTSGLNLIPEPNRLLAGTLGVVIIIIIIIVVVFIVVVFIVVVVILVVLRLRIEFDAGAKWASGRGLS